MIRTHIRPAVAATVVLSVLTGVLYPGAVTIISQFLFPSQANGSIIRDAKGRVIGSTLIAQAFAQPYYFHPRPSAAGAGYDAMVSAGTNKGPTDRKLADTLIANAVHSAEQIDHAIPRKIPADMATSSASGLDPDISPANALLQVPRVALARGVDSARVRTLVEQHVTGRQFGVLGEPRVNVLQLNMALDRAFPRHT